MAFISKGLLGPKMWKHSESIWKQKPKWKIANPVREGRKIWNFWKPELFHTWNHRYSRLWGEKKNTPNRSITPNGAAWKSAGFKLFGSVLAFLQNQKLRKLCHSEIWAAGASQSQNIRYTTNFVLFFFGPPPSSPQTSTLFTDCQGFWRGRVGFLESCVWRRGLVL